MNNSKRKKSNIGNILNGLISPFMLKTNNEELPGLLEDLEHARLEWRHAHLYFDNVTDPDLIDYAIFYMGATEKKYVYLLKQARETGIDIHGYEFGVR